MLRTVLLHGDAYKLFRVRGQGGLETVHDGTRARLSSLGFYKPGTIESRPPRRPAVPSPPVPDCDVCATYSRVNGSQFLTRAV